MSVELKGQFNSFVKHAIKCGFCSKLYTIQKIADNADIDLFRKTAKPYHCVNSVLPPAKSSKHYL